MYVHSNNDVKTPAAILILNQGLLELLWTVYSEGKLQSCLKLRNFQNSFNKDMSVNRSMRHTIRDEWIPLFSDIRILG